MLKLRAKYQGRHNTLVLFVQKKICLVPKSVTCLSVSLAVARYRMTSDKSGFGDICSSSEWISYEQTCHRNDIRTDDQWMAAFVKNENELLVFEDEDTIAAKVRIFRCSMLHLSTSILPCDLIVQNSRAGCAPAG